MLSDGMLGACPPPPLPRLSCPCIAMQRYVKPDQHAVLTQFCTELTGITQDMWVLLAALQSSSGFGAAKPS